MLISMHLLEEEKKQNEIHTLVDHNGRSLTEHKEMELEILKFYKELVGTAAKNLLLVDIEVIRQGPQLQEESSRGLTIPATEQEVWKALKSIVDSKAPGLDGFNSKNFKHTWNIVKIDLMAAIKDFFENQHMYPAVNCALVTLIPKITDAKCMKDIHPIACCSTVYKIISKILTTRLSNVINEVIDVGQ